ncbi:zinc-binding dehydrogenase, partial [bacterium]|nr:zinc-binding dehydrogenase [bacterium]
IPPHVHRQNCLPLPAGLSFEAAALTEPLACCLYGVKRAGIAAGDSVLIIGDGPIGLMMAALARERGADRVGLAGKNRERLRAAQRMGAQMTFEKGGNIRAAFPPHGPDVVIECVGDASTWREALTVVRPGGRILLFGGCPPGQEVGIDAGKIHYGNLTIHGTFHFTPAEVREALDLLRRGVIDAGILITDRAPLADINKYFSDGGAKSYLKVAFLP